MPSSLPAPLLQLIDHCLQLQLQPLEPSTQEKYVVVLSTGTSLSLCRSCQGSPKVVLRSQDNLDSLNLEALYAVEGNVNSNPFLIAKALVSCEQTS